VVTIVPPVESMVVVGVGAGTAVVGVVPALPLLVVGAGSSSLVVGLLVGLVVSSSSSDVVGAVVGVSSSDVIRVDVGGIRVTSETEVGRTVPVELTTCRFTTAFS
jgi:hypothetical protein